MNSHLLAYPLKHILTNARGEPAIAITDSREINMMHISASTADWGVAAHKMQVFQHWADCEAYIQPIVLSEEHSRTYLAGSVDLLADLIIFSKQTFTLPGIAAMCALHIAEDRINDIREDRATNIIEVTSADIRRLVDQ